MSVGYNIKDIQMPELPETKPGTHIKVLMRPQDEPANRPVVAVGLGCELYGCARPHANPNDREGMIEGVLQRAARRPPEKDPEMVRGWKAWTYQWVRDSFEPIDPTYDFSVESWLQKTAYPDWKKKELLEVANDETNFFDPKFRKVRGFMKDEAYDDWKRMRMINPRHPKFLCLVGPVFTAIEEILFKYPAFVKGIPRDQWPKVIMEDLLPDYETIAIDHTAFEAHCDEEAQEVEWIVYDYLLSRVSENVWFQTLCREAFGGRQDITYKFIRVIMRAVRESGDRQTSGGNAIINYTGLRYVAHHHSLRVGAKVEGDDSLSQWHPHRPHADWWRGIGFVVKLEVHNSPATASFCGLIFDVNDEINIGDPLRMMAKFGWTTRQYAKSKIGKLRMLAKAKAYSALYQFAGCPIISNMAMWIIRLTRHVDLRPLLKSGSLNVYEREELLMAIKCHWRLVQVARRRPTLQTRLLMEDKFGVTVNRQLELEAWFDRQKTIRPIPSDWVIDLVPQSWVDYWTDYCFKADIRRDFDANYT